MATKNQAKINSDFFGIPDPISSIGRDLDISSGSDYSEMFDIGDTLKGDIGRDVDFGKSDLGFGDILSGGSFKDVGADATAGQNFFGYIDKETKTKVGGYGQGIFDLATTLGSGYMQWKNMKNMEKAREQQQQQWMMNYGAQKHAYNQEAASINAARQSASSGGHRIEQMK